MTSVYELDLCMATVGDGKLCGEGEQKGTNGESLFPSSMTLFEVLNEGLTTDRLEGQSEVWTVLL